MSELDYEEPPALEVNVPRVRPWLVSALRDWTRACYPPRHGVTIVWGCLFVVPWAIFQSIKFFVWLTGVGVALAFYPVWVTAELITYSHRRKRALLREWTRYILDLHDEPPPPTAA